ERPNPSAAPCEGGQDNCVWVATSGAEPRGRQACRNSSFDLNRWTTLRRWVSAVGAGELLARIVAWRRWPGGMSLRAGAERAAACLRSLGPGTGTLAEQVFAGAARAA